MAELFDDLIGQPRAVALLAAALARGRLAPAYLFTGAEGVGRRLAALRFLEGILTAGGAGAAAALRRRLAAGNHPDLLWVEPTYQHQGRLVPASRALEEGVSRRSPPQLRLEQVRLVSRFLARSPVEAPRGLVVIEAAEAMAEAAANALLKTLEEPGEGLLILISASPDRLLGTIRSRCQQVPFRRLTPAEMARVLATAASAEPGGEANDPAEVLAMAAGSPGALLEHRRRWHELPEGLADRLLALGDEPLAALGLARDLCESLDGEQQQWLLSWWQQALWRRCCQPAVLRRLETLRGQLLSHVQPRLAWEVALLDLIGPSTGSAAAG